MFMIDTNKDDRRQRQAGAVVKLWGGHQMQVSISLAHAPFHSVLPLSPLPYLLSLFPFLLLNQGKDIDALRYDT